MSILLALLQTITFTFSSVPAQASAHEGPRVDRSALIERELGRGPINPCASVGCR